MKIAPAMLHDVFIFGDTIHWPGNKTCNDLPKKYLDNCQVLESISEIPLMVKENYYCNIVEELAPLFKGLSFSCQHYKSHKIVQGGLICLR